MLKKKIIEITANKNVHGSAVWMTWSVKFPRTLKKKKDIAMSF